MFTKDINPAYRYKSRNALRFVLFVALVFVMALSWTSVVYAEGGDTEGTDTVQTGDADQQPGAGGQEP